MQELDYNPSKKDLTDAKIHHLLAEELKPYKRVSLEYLSLVQCVLQISNNAFYKYICWTIKLSGAKRQNQDTLTIKLIQITKKINLKPVKKLNCCHFETAQFTH